MIGAILGFVVFCHVGMLFIPEGTRRKRFQLWMMMCTGKFILTTMGVKVNVEGKHHLAKGNFLVLCNHVSYIDSVILGSVFPGVPVTSFEIRDNTVIEGWACKSAGCLFVERRNWSTLRRDIKALGELLSQGLHVVLFPEGTTTDNSVMLPFRRSLMQGAIDVNHSILPVSLTYDRINGEAVTDQNKDLIYYYGGMKFVPHLKKALELKSVEVTVRIGEPISHQRLPTRSAMRRDVSGRAYKVIDQMRQLN